MKRHFSFFLARSKTFFSSHSLQSSFLALVSGVMLCQPVFANDSETFYFRRDYQESGYRLDGKFTATDTDFDNIISAAEVSRFAAFLTDLDDGFKESINFGIEKNITDFHYDLNSYLSGSHDLKFQVETIKNNYTNFFAPLNADRESRFPVDSSWNVNFTKDTDFFQITDYIIAGMDSERNGFVTFVEDDRGGNGTTTPEASSLGGIILVGSVLFSLKKRSH